MFVGWFFTEIKKTHPTNRTIIQIGYFRPLGSKIITCAQSALVVDGIAINYSF